MNLEYAYNEGWLEDYSDDDARAEMTRNYISDNFNLFAEDYARDNGLEFEDVELDDLTSDPAIWKEAELEVKEYV